MRWSSGWITSQCHWPTWLYRWWLGLGDYPNITSFQVGGSAQTIAVRFIYIYIYMNIYVYMQYIYIYMFFLPSSVSETMTLNSTPVLLMDSPLTRFEPGSAAPANRPRHHAQWRVGRFGACCWSSSGASCWHRPFWFSFGRVQLS